MDKQAMPILAKPIQSNGVSAEPQERSYNAVTIAAHKEAQDIINGIKKTKSYGSAEEFLADLKS